MFLTDIQNAILFLVINLWYYRVVFVLALQVVLNELDVVDGLLQLKRILLPDGGRHIVERVVNGRNGRVHQPASRPGRSRRPVATGPAGGRHEPAQRVGGRTVAGGRRSDRRRRHVQRGAHAGCVQPVQTYKKKSVRWRPEVYATPAISASTDGKKITTK